VFRLEDKAALADTKKNPIIIKEGVEYKYVYTLRAIFSGHCGLTALPVSALPSKSTTRSSPYVVIRETHARSESQISPTHWQGARYLQVVKRAGVKGKILLFFAMNFDETLNCVTVQLIN